MKVSIVIPVYNAQEFILECVESALNQTYDEIEIIAVDDGSKDNSLEILKRYADKIKIISKQNGGTGSALNTGIKVMKGEWLKWLSADDLLYPNAIQDLITVAEKLDTKNYILYSNYDKIDSQGNIIEPFIEPNYNNLEGFDMNVILLDHFIGNGTTSLIHKSAFDKFGLFDERVGLAQDYELWLRLCILHNFRLHLVPKILAKYRVHQTQLTKKKVGALIKSSNKAKKFVLSKLEPPERKKYEEALKRDNRKRPLLIRSHQVVMDLMLRFLPESTSNKILPIYLSAVEKLTYFYLKNKRQ